LQTAHTAAMYVLLLCVDAELMVQRSEHRKTKDSALNTRKVKL
jgi:hypothetical protein